MSKKPTADIGQQEAPTPTTLAKALAYVKIFEGAVIVPVNTSIDWNYKLGIILSMILELVESDNIEQIQASKVKALLYACLVISDNIGETLNSALADSDIHLPALLKILEGES